MKKDNKAYSILVVEDNLGDFALVEDYLNDEILNPNIIHALNFKQAIPYITDQNCTLDVIILDISLPDINSKDLIDEMMRISSNCPVIILTGYADMDFSISSITKGVTDYLLKDELNANLLYRSIVYAIERKKTIAQLEESEKRYGDMFYLSPQPKWVFDCDSFRFIQVNKAAIELYGYTQEEFMSMTLMDIKSDEDVAKVKDAIRNRKDNNKVVIRTATHFKKNGDPIEIELYSSLVKVNHKNFGLVVAIDVTEKNLYQHNIVKAIIKAQEDERYDIGGELHDNVCQLLGASKLYLSMLKDNLPPEKQNFYKECDDNICAALNEIRNLSHRLAPAFFEDTSLEESFKKLFKTFSVDGDLEIILNFEEKITKKHLNRELQLNLYRIMQEQLKNIIKYAKASIVEVDVIIFNHKLKMQIADNGIGFNSEDARGGIGLANMKRRTELFNGIFEINSSPGNGCIIIIDIPLEEEEKALP